MKSEIFDTSILYVENKNIDREKWDKCIEQSCNGSIYVLSFYLDTMSKNWDALILNDYEIVMPLIWNKKYGFHYLYQPYFLHHTGIFGNTIKAENTPHFLLHIPEHFRYWDIDYKENIIDPGISIIPGLHLKKRRNFFLDLKNNYQKIEHNYKRLAKRMLLKAKQNNIEVIRNSPPAEIINFYKNNYRNRQKNILDSDYKRLITVTEIAFKNNLAATYLAKTVKGEIIAAYLILRDKKYVYSIIGGSNAAGKTYGAFYLLTAAAIKDHAETDRIFRFEGSDKKGIALFNSKFNPFPLEYYHLKLNRLPWPLKLLKK